MQQAQEQARVRTLFNRDALEKIGASPFQLMERSVGTGSVFPEPAYFAVSYYEEKASRTHSGEGEYLAGRYVPLARGVCDTKRLQMNK